MTTVQTLLLIQISAFVSSFAVSFLGISIQRHVAGHVLFSMVAVVVGWFSTISVAQYLGIAIGIETYLRAVLGYGFWFSVFGSAAGFFYGRTLVRKKKKSEETVSEEFGQVEAEEYVIADDPEEVDFGNETARATETIDTAKFTSTLHKDTGVDEDAIYESISEELDCGTMKKGLWTRLYAENGGDDTKTKVEYIKQRAGKMINESQKKAEEQEAKLRTYAEQEYLYRQDIEKRRHKEGAIRENKRISMLIKQFFSYVREDDIDSVSKMLAKSNFLIDATDSHNNTPLHIALIEKSFKVANFLILEGATFTKNDQGQTQLDMAESMLRCGELDRNSSHDAKVTLRALGLTTRSIYNFTTAFFVCIAIVLFIFMVLEYKNQ